MLPGAGRADALYACTDCELSVSPNSCVIENDKPVFMPVSDILRKSVDDTVALLLLELKIKLGELETDWQYSSLEKIFIEERIYKDKEFEESGSVEEVVVHVRRPSIIIHTASEDGRRYQAVVGNQDEAYLEV